MISILIPCYDYFAYPLVSKIEKQALVLNIEYEIICIDDGSFSSKNEANQKINVLTNCKFLESKKNLGRIQNRVLLANSAQYDWLIYVDVDTTPISNNFLEKYINLIGKSALIFGGCSFNESTKIENDFLKKIDFEKIKNDNNDVIVLYDKNMNEGLIGIIASRLKDHFNKPAIVLTKSNNILKASARSTPNFNIGKYIKLCIDKKIIENGGGHNLAAGFTIKKENLDIFKTYINEIFKEKKIIQNKKEYISELSLNAISKSFFNDLKILAPYGANNITPSFLIRNVLIIKPKIIKEKFLSFYLKSKSSKLFPAISFNNLESIIAKMLMYNKNELSVIVQIKENQWNNKKNLQLVVLDIISQPNKA